MDAPRYDVSISQYTFLFIDCDLSLISTVYSVRIAALKSAVFSSISVIQHLLFGGCPTGPLAIYHW